MDGLLEKLASLLGLLDRLTRDSTLDILLEADLP